MKEWNLLAKCLTSKQACAALNEYLCSHPSLHDEIENKTGTVFGIKNDNNQNPAMEEDSIDDSDIPSSVVVAESLSRLTLDMVQSDNQCVSQWEKDGESGGWVANDDQKDILAWNNAGERWGDDLPMQGTK